MKEIKNPVNEIREKEGLTYQELANLANISSSTVYKNITGGNFKVTAELLELFEQMGYNMEEIQDQYQEFKKYKRQQKLNEYVN